ncbi:enterochelin esterase [Streptomyces sp. MS06]|uniref:enterochelin esterase n=1 Tax=Streptomyces sp. MS06 TaxID=3385974 RepID=UPI00399F8B7C
MTFTAPPEGAPHRPPRSGRPQPLPVLAEPAFTAPRPDGLADFWADVRRRGTPLVGGDPLGDPDRRAVTFLWRGSTRTRAVQVLPNKLADPDRPAGNLMRRLPGTDVWHWTVRLRSDWRGTYDLFVDEGGGPDPDDPGYWRWLRVNHRPDPFNTRTLPRRWGGPPVACAELPDAPDARDWQRRAGVPRGTVTEHEIGSGHLGDRRRVWLYAPPGPPGPGPATAPGGLPVLVLLDGEHWQPRLGVANLLDNLIADGRIPPLAAVLPESLDLRTRWAQLTCRPEFAAFLEHELLPWAATRLPLTRDPARTVLAGQSLGGLTAAYAALHRPHRFGNALVQSGSFWWPDGPEAEWLTGRLAATGRRPVRLWLSFGEQEWVALPAARRLRETLAAAGYDDAVYREFNGGHDYLCWRTELADGLVALLSAT